MACLHSTCGDNSIQGIAASTFVRSESMLFLYVSHVKMHSHNPRNDDHGEVFRMQCFKI